MFNNANSTAQAGRENSTIAAQDSPGRPSTSLLPNSTSSLRKPAVDFKRCSLDVGVCTPEYEARTEGETWGLDTLIEQWNAHELEPLDIPLEIERIPERYYALRELATCIQFWFGLGLAKFEFTDIPLSSRYVARRMNWMVKGKPDHRRASNALNALVRYGVIAPGTPHPKIQVGGRMCLTWRPPEPLATELGYEHYKPDLSVVQIPEEIAA